MPRIKNQDGREYAEAYAEQTWGSKDQKQKMFEFLQSYKDIYYPNFHLWTSLYAQAYEDLGMYLGDQWSHAEVEARRQQRRNCLTFNHIFRTINSIAGYFTQSQLGYTVQSVHGDEEGSRTADILTDCLRRVCYREDVYDKIANCVREACITGWSGIRAYIDHTPGVGMEIKVRNVSWSNMIIDPTISERDLSDCSYLAMRSLMPKATLMGMYPDYAGDIRNLNPSPTNGIEFPWAPQVRIPMLDKHKLNYTEMYRKIARKQDFLFDPDTNDLTYWDGDDALFRRVRSAYPKVQLVKKDVPVIEYGILVEDLLVHYSENPYGCNCYPVQPFFAIFEPRHAPENKVKSLTSVVSDAQKAYNKRKNALLDILDTNLQSGVIYKEGAVLNPESLYNIRAGQNVCVKNEYGIPESIQQLSPVEVPTSIFQATHELETNINTLLGVNPEMFGQTQGGSEDPTEMSGVLYRMKQASALTGMQSFFASARAGHKHFGEILMNMILANYTPEKYEKISNKKPTVELSIRDWPKFNLVIQEGLIEDRNANLEHLLALRSLGVPISTRMIIEASPVYNKAEIIEYAEQQEQIQAQLQQLEIEKQRQTIENLAQDLRSEAARNQAQALETLTTIGAKAAQKEETIARTQKIKSDTVAQFAEVMKKIAELPPESMKMALQYLTAMTETVEASVDVKKQLVEQEADLAIATRLPPQDLTEEESSGFQPPTE